MGCAMRDIIKNLTNSKKFELLGRYFKKVKIFYFRGG